MPRMSMTVTLAENGEERTESVVATGVDVLDYEAEFEESFLTQTTYAQLTKLAWVALRRAGRFDGDFKEFRRQFRDLDETNAYEAGLDPARPTQTDPGDGS